MSSIGACPRCLAEWDGEGLCPDCLLDLLLEEVYKECSNSGAKS